MFTIILTSAAIGILAGLIACMMCSKETYQEDLVDWNG